jgi:hypothetical protein
MQHEKEFPSFFLPNKLIELILTVILMLLSLEDLIPKGAESQGFPSRFTVESSFPKICDFW